MKGAMAAGPLVSVVMAARDAERWVEQAVGSVLVQTWRELELVVVDDGSVDRTPEIVLTMARSDSRVRLLRHERPVGLATATNAGLREVRGELVARLDADDYMLTDRLTRQVAFMTAHPDIALVGSAGHVIAERTRRSLGPTPVFHGRALHWALHLWCVVLHPTVMMRRAALPPGGYPTGTRFCMDWALFLDLQRRARLDIMAEPLIVYRRHAHAIGRAHAAAQDESNRDVFRRYANDAFAIDLRPTTAMTWVRPAYAAATEDARELAELARMLAPDALALGSHVPDWAPGELARCRRVYARRLAEIVWRGRSRRDVVRHLGPIAAAALARAVVA